MQSGNREERGGWPELADLWTDAWGQVPGSKRIFLGFFLLQVVAVLLGTALVDIGGALLPGAGLADEFAEPTIIDRLYTLFGMLVIAALTVPFGVALAGAALERARGNRISLAIIGKYREVWPRALVLALLVLLANYLFELALPFTAFSLELVDGWPLLSISLLAPITEALLVLALLNMIDWDASVPGAAAASLRLLISRPLLVIAYMVFAALTPLLMAVTLGVAAVWLLPFTHIFLAFAYLRNDAAARETSGARAAVGENR